MQTHPLLAAGEEVERYQEPQGVELVAGAQNLLPVVEAETGPVEVEENRS